MDNTTTTPEYLFESSWEVCNKVGGIYTVLSTKAHTLQRSFKDKLIFIGPDVWTDTNAPDFIEDDVLFADWKTYTKTTENLKVKVGRWNVPGTPPVILVDFKPFFKERDSFFFSMWESFRVDSIHAYGDYDESCIFAYAVGKRHRRHLPWGGARHRRAAGLCGIWQQFLLAAGKIGISECAVIAVEALLAPALPFCLRQRQAGGQDGDVLPLPAFFLGKIFSQRQTRMLLHALPPRFFIWGSLCRCGQSGAARENAGAALY
jgi:hypothetical protein